MRTTTELNEITDGMNLKALEAELKFQLSMGEDEGGTICSHVRYLIQKASK